MKISFPVSRTGLTVLLMAMVLAMPALGSYTLVVSLAGAGVVHLDGVNLTVTGP